MKRKSLCFVVLLILLGCQNRSVIFCQLTRIDSLLTTGHADSALVLVKRIDNSKLHGEELAYYYLLRTQSEYNTYQQITSDSTISLAISYYSSIHELKKLARSYFYRAGIRYGLGKEKDALDDLQRAKEINKKISGNDALCHNVFFLIASINISHHEYELAVKNSKQALNYSLKTQKMDCIAYDYVQLSCIYYNIGNQDSSRFFIDKSISMIEKIPEKPAELRASVIGNLGIACYKTYPDKSKQLLQESLSLSPSGNAYDALARIYLQDKDTARAQQLLLKGMEKSERAEYRIGIYRLLGKIAQETGNYREATEWMQKAQELKDSLTHQQQKDNILAQQMAFDGAVKQERASTKLMYALLAIGVAALAGIVAFWFLRRKTTKERQELKTANRRLRSASKKLNKLEQERKEEKKEQRRLEKTLENGHILYTELLSGGNVNCWKKKEIVELMVYYRHNNPSFNEEIEQEHKNLTPSQILYLILKDMGRSQQDIIQIMGLSTGAFNTMCSRMKTR